MRQHLYLADLSSKSARSASQAKRKMRQHLDLADLSSKSDELVEVISLFALMVWPYVTVRPRRPNKHSSPLEPTELFPFNPERLYGRATLRKVTGCT